MLAGYAPWRTVAFAAGRLASCIVRVRNDASRGVAVRSVTSLALAVLEGAPRREAMVEEVSIASGTVGQVVLPWGAYDGAAIPVATDALAFRISVRHCGDDGGGGDGGGGQMEFGQSGRWMRPGGAAVAGLRSFRAVGVDALDARRV